MKARVVVLTLVGVVLAAAVARWGVRNIQAPEPAWPKIEALTDAAKNGLITQREYERKVTELVGGSERKAAAIRKASQSANGAWTANDGRKISALGEALTTGAITEEQFDAKVAEYARERQAESAGISATR